MRGSHISTAEKESFFSHSQDVNTLAVNRVAVSCTSKTRTQFYCQIDMLSAIAHA